MTEKRIEELETICAQAYLLLGRIYHAEYTSTLAIEKMLDNLGDAKLGHENIDFTEGKSDQRN